MFNEVAHPLFSANGVVVVHQVACLLFNLLATFALCDGTVVDDGILPLAPSTGLGFTFLLPQEKRNSSELDRDVIPGSAWKPELCQGCPVCGVIHSLKFWPFARQYSR